MHAKTHDQRREEIDTPHKSLNSNQLEALLIESDRCSDVISELINYVWSIDPTR